MTAESAIIVLVIYVLAQAADWFFNLRGGGLGQHRRKK